MLALHWEGQRLRPKRSYPTPQATENSALEDWDDTVQTAKSWAFSMPTAVSPSISPYRW